MSRVAERREFRIDAEGPLGGSVSLPGDLVVPQSARGIVLFAHGSGSSRSSSRNVQVASTLSQAGLGTRLFDLLTPEESRDRRLVFDTPLLAERLLTAAGWVEDRLPDLSLGHFGASTGAAAALWAAAEPAHDVRAIVSRGGRPDLAGERLELVTAPTLLIVGGADLQVLELNRQAQRMMRCPSELVVIPGAGHLFEEPGALERVSELATEWFVRYLT